MKEIYLIKDLARLSGHTIYTLKYYLNLGLIKEIGRSPETNFRYFDNITLERLQKIRALRKENRSLAEIKEMLTE
ncbi:MAG: MerR family transcriptional regulator [Candidatus Omnitrophica bacterium]|nr:MerR family transcriptional regulator [Candidatus Omnitrophota bacterium]MBU1932892.1 MerR family transcriptional regulator [Candidatus Omnitrophota bacterium]